MQGSLWHKMLLGWLIIGLAGLSVAGCSQAYRFQYHYVMTDPPGGSEGVQDESVRILVTPVAKKGLLDLAITNKRIDPISIVWEQTHFIDPFGKRQLADEAGVSWFFRPQSWVADGATVDPGREFQVRVHSGSRQTYNPFTISRQESGAVNLSTSPQALMPTSGATSAIGEAYQGRDFQFILALRIDARVVHYPFTFRITQVDVQRPAER